MKIKSGFLSVILVVLLSSIMNVALAGGSTTGSKSGEPESDSYEVPL